MADINTTEKLDQNSVQQDDVQKEQINQVTNEQEKGVPVENIEQIKDNVLDNASKSISDTMEVAGDTVKAINEVVNSASETVKAATSIINSMTDSGKDIPTIVDDTTKNIQKTIDAASDTFRAVNEAVKAIDDTVKVAEGAITDIYSSIEEPLNDTIGKISDKISESLPENPQDLLKSPIIQGTLITLSFSLIAWGLYSILKPKQVL